MTLTTIDPTERFTRQKDLVPAERLGTCRASVIGVGAIGRQVALQLTAIGIGQLQLVDPDVVETVNLSAQGYFEADLGQPKVQATAALCRQIDSRVQIQVLPERFRRSLEVGNVLFCCVDSIQTRSHIWQAVHDRVLLFADGRMNAEVLRVLIAADGASRQHYPSTLFAQEQAHAGSCTAKSTIYCANLAAALMLSQFTRWLRRLPIEADITLNLLASEWTCGTSMVT